MYIVDLDLKDDQMNFIINGKKDEVFGFIMTYIS